LFMGGGKPRENSLPSRPWFESARAGDALRLA
jgi:hypothetical protein